jgi:hypothetical protein
VREGKEYSRGKVSSSRGKAWDIWDHARGVMQLGPQ